MTCFVLPTGCPLGIETVAGRHDVRPVATERWGVTPSGPAVNRQPPVVDGQPPAAIYCPLSNRLRAGLSF